eukprot:6491729-Amphidinium_carterae.3
MSYTTTGINQENQAHRQKIPTRTTTTKRRRTQDSQSLNRKQPKRSHDERTTTTERKLLINQTERNDATTKAAITRQQYFAEEAAREDDINYDDQQTANIDVNSFNKRLQYSRQLLRLLLSIGRLCDDWRRRPIQGTLQFVQRHEQDLKYISTRTKTLPFITCMFLLSTLLLRSHFATIYVETSSTLGDVRTMAADSEDNEYVTDYPLKEQ